MESSTREKGFLSRRVALSSSHLQVAGHVCSQGIRDPQSTGVFRKIHFEAADSSDQLDEGGCDNHPINGGTKPPGGSPQPIDQSI